MRRMKLWVTSAPGFDQHWGYRVQTTITSFQNERFFLQDVLAWYRNGPFRVNLGQFIPHYSLQRFQPDFVVPLTERSAAINLLIPNGTLGIRDIGAEINYTVESRNFESWLGVFNGNGIKEYRLNNSGIMVTNKSVVHLAGNRLDLGYSAMYRKADNLKLALVLPDTVLFSGDDIRFNLLAKWQTGRFNIQGEYLSARLDNDRADGWYILTSYNLGKSQLVGSFNRYNDLISTSSDDPVIHLGYNYLAKGDKLKFMIDNGAAVADGGLNNYFVILQVQMFFN